VNKTEAARLAKLYVASMVNLLDADDDNADLLEIKNNMMPEQKRIAQTLLKQSGYNRFGITLKECVEIYENDKRSK
jgi:hypothetical protein